MQTIKATKRPDINYRDYIKRSALERDFEQLIDHDCILVDAETGQVLVVYKELDFNDQGILWALNTIRYDSNTRTNGLKTTSRIFGYSPRIPLRKDFCSTTSLALDQPEQHAEVCKYGVKIAGLYSKFTPETYGQHQQIIKAKVLDEYAIKDTPFTSGIINKNNPLKYHFDSGNFKNVYSCMAVFKQDIEGGHLSLPEYGVGFELRHNSVFMFDGQSILHGVTPIRRLSSKANRYSIVYYSLQKIWNCLPLTEEVARIRQLKTKRERGRAAQMRGEEELPKSVQREQARGQKIREAKAKAAQSERN